MKISSQNRIVDRSILIIGHDRIFQRIEVMFSQVFRFYTLLDDLPKQAVRRAQSRLHLIENVSLP